MTTSEQSTASAETHDEPRTIEDLETEIEHTREELGVTVDALAHKLDVKSRAHDKVDDMKSVAQEKVEDVRTVVHDKTSAVGSQISDVGERVKPLAQRREVQAAAGAVLLGVGAVVVSVAAESEDPTMVKLLYKPIAIGLGILAGSLAGKVVTKVWTKVDDNDIPPEPDLKETSWALVIAGAALQGVVYSVVKAAVKRGGAQGVEKVTGTWPGKTADDLEPAAA